MKRISILFMVLGLVAGSVATAEAAKKTKQPTRVERTVEESYGPFPAPVTGCNDLGGPFACAVIPTRTTEAFFTAKVTDAHGLPVFVEVSAASGNGAYNVARFCGETTEPIRFHPGSDLFFYVGLPVWPSVQAAAACPANKIKTTGTISVTLSHQGPEPVRSGSILSGTGWFLDSQTGGCQVSPECAAWLYTDCGVNLTYGHGGRGVTASIVDIDELADGPPVERVFRFGAGDPWTPVWGGAQLQFWTSDCVEVPDTRWRSTDCDGNGGNCRSTRLRIPPSAKWMTVTGYQDNVHLVWSLT